MRKPLSVQAKKDRWAAATIKARGCVHVPQMIEGVYNGRQSPVRLTPARFAFTCCSALYTSVFGVIYHPVLDS